MLESKKSKVALGAVLAFILLMLIGGVVASKGDYQYPNA